MRGSERVERGSRLNLLWMFFLLGLASCGDIGGGDIVDGPPVDISGVVYFESVQPTVAGLDYSNSVHLPVRYVSVEALSTIGNRVLDSTVTDGSGHYTLTVPGSNPVFIRAKAKSVSTTPPAWDVEIVDNTAGKALYVLDSAVFNSGDVSTMTKDLYALSGWNGSSYSGARAAAPFAILDTMYKAVELVANVDPTVVIPLLVVNWSVNNIPAPGETANGYITSSHYTSAENQLYILGLAGNDTDEYDSHVIAHEWAHFFEFNLGRSDSIGGGHGPGDLLDPRVAFGEGFGNAFSGMVLNDPLYVDTYGSTQNSGFSINVENNDFDTTSVGWYSEASVQSILYDIFDSVSDGPDSVGLGFGPIYNVLVDDAPQQESFVTIYSFIDSLKVLVPGSVASLNALLAYENISTTFVDEWDSSKTETNFSVIPAAPSAVYTEIPVGGASASLCGSPVYGVHNNLFNRRFFYFTALTSRSYTISAVPSLSAGDVDFMIYRAGIGVASAANDASGSFSPEIVTQVLAPGVYVGEVYEWGHITGAATSAECFSVTIQ